MIARIGRSRGLSQDIFPPSAAELDIGVASSASMDEVTAAIRDQLVVPALYLRFGVEDIQAGFRGAAVNATPIGRAGSHP